MTSIVRRTGISRAVVAALALITAVPLAAGQAQAAPEPVDSVRATVQRNADSVKVELLSGSLAVDGADLVVRNQAGAVLTKVPLQVRGPKDEVYPLAATVSGRTATLTPPPAARAAVALERTRVERRIVGPQTKSERDDLALQQFNADLSVAVIISSIVGLVLGCIVGLPLAGVGCLVFAPIGSFVGLMIGGGGSAIVLGIRYFNTINSPFKPQYQNVVPKAKTKPGRPANPKKN